MKEFINSINPADAIEAAKYIAMLILGASTLYFKTKASLVEIGGKYVSAAERLYEDNETRFNWVVDQAYKIVPAAMRPFISKKAVGEAVQTAFDIAKAYFKSRADQAIDKITRVIPEPKMREVPREW